jgi:hypothetical protein
LNFAAPAVEPPLAGVAVADRVLRTEGAGVGVAAAGAGVGAACPNPAARLSIASGATDGVARPPRPRAPEPFGGMTLFDVC